VKHNLKTINETLPLKKLFVIMELKCHIFITIDTYYSTELNPLVNIFIPLNMFGTLNTCYNN